MLYLVRSLGGSYNFAVAQLAYFTASADRTVFFFWHQLLNFYWTWVIFYFIFVFYHFLNFILIFVFFFFLFLIKPLFNCKRLFHSSYTRSSKCLGIFKKCREFYATGIDLLIKTDPLAKCSPMALKTRVQFPCRVIPKTQKMVLDASLLVSQHYKVRVEWSNPGKGVALFPDTSV